jgi:hypothetical protein
VAREVARVRHRLLCWTAGGAWAALGLWSERGANFPSSPFVLLVLGAFLALSLARAPQRP